MVTKYIFVAPGFYIIQYQLVIVIPSDINECKQGSDRCDHNCTNTVGSYNCTCMDGYRLVTHTINILLAIGLQILNNHHSIDLELLLVIS